VSKTTDTYEELRKLDYLASRFIIGHKKLTKSQIKIYNDIKSMEKEELRLRNRLKRIERIIAIMYLKIIKPKHDGRHDD
jgi:hypothetical protein